MIIQTDRLELRPFVAEDFSWFKDVAMNDEVQMLLPGVTCGEDSAINETISLYAKGDFVNDFYYVVCDKNNNALGIIIAVRVSSMTVDVSYFLKQDSRHRGYMREAVAGFINGARKVQPLYRFRFVIAAHNKASLNVVKSLGATVQEVLGNYICCL